MKRIAALALVSLTCSSLPAQWLPADRQAHERALWELTGVEFPKGMQFYDLPKVSQRLVGIVNYSPENRFGIFTDKYRGKDNVNAQMPWTTPSGLHDSPHDQWRKVAGVYLPGKVKVRVQTVIVQNGIRRPGGGFYSQPQPQIAWTFPDGTIFAEMLVRTHGKYEWPFEIRQYEIRGGKFTDGTTFRPDVPTTDAWQITVPAGKLSDFGLGAEKLIAKTPATKEYGPFKATREILTAAGDDDLVPRNFVGNVRACRDCHAHAGKPTSYGATTIRGGGEAISWHPFRTDRVNTDADPVLDGRWPLEVQSNRLTVR